jgi:hypothetical protein
MLGGRSGDTSTEQAPSTEETKTGVDHESDSIGYSE